MTDHDDNSGMTLRPGESSNNALGPKELMQLARKLADPEFKSMPVLADYGAIELPLEFPALEWKSIYHRAFGTYLRTGRLVTMGEGLSGHELKFNPYHDALGRFTFAPGGGAEAKPAKPVGKNAGKDGKTPSTSKPQPVAAHAAGRTVTYTNSDGSTYTETGTHPDRDNNPLDLKLGGAARDNGSIGSDNGFAIFPNADDGYAAAVERMGQIAQSPGVHGQAAGSLANIVYIWSPPSENDTEGMISDITEWTGLSRNDQYASLTPAQQQDFVRAYAKREGYSPD